MASRILDNLEKQISELNQKDKLWLLEKLARTLRKDADSSTISDDDLDEMAADPAVQRELSQIATEFSVTEEDGLGGL